MANERITKANWRRRCVSYKFICVWSLRRYPCVDCRLSEAPIFDWSVVVVTVSSVYLNNNRTPCHFRILWIRIISFVPNALNNFGKLRLFLRPNVDLYENRREKIINNFPMFDARGSTGRGRRYTVKDHTIAFCVCFVHSILFFYLKRTRFVLSCFLISQTWLIRPH